MVHIRCRQIGIDAGDPRWNSVYRQVGRVKRRDHVGIGRKPTRLVNVARGAIQNLRSNQAGAVCQEGRIVAGIGRDRLFQTVVSEAKSTANYELVLKVKWAPREANLRSEVSLG